MTEYVTVWKDHEPTKLHWGVPVVRCRDCKHRRGWTHEELSGFDEAQVADGWCRFIRMGVDDVDYCAWGERKGDAE